SDDASGIADGSNRVNRPGSGSAREGIHPNIATTDTRPKNQRDRARTCAKASRRTGVARMKRSFLLMFVPGLVAISCMASAQRRFGLEESDTIRRTLDFSAGNGRKILEVDNVNGRIRVTGYDGATVEM